MLCGVGFGVRGVKDHRRAELRERGPFGRLHEVRVGGDEHIPASADVRVQAQDVEKAVAPLVVRLIPLGPLGDAPDRVGVAERAR